MNQIDLDTARQPGVSMEYDVMQGSSGFMLSELYSDERLRQNLISEILTQPYSLGHLNHESILDTQMVDDLDTRVLKAGLISVASGIGEGEVVATQRPQFETLGLTLNKDVLKFAISPEMMARKLKITPIDYLKSREGEAFTYALDKRIQTALNTSPMVLDAALRDVDRDGANYVNARETFLEETMPVVAEVFESMNTEPTAMIMRASTAVKLTAFLNRNSAGMGTWKETDVPGFSGCSQVRTNLVDANTIWFVSKAVPAMKLYCYQNLEDKQQYDIDTDTTVFQCSVFRSVATGYRTGDWKYYPIENGQFSETVKTIKNANCGVLKVNLHWDASPNDSLLRHEPVMQEA